MALETASRPTTPVAEQESARVLRRPRGRLAAALPLAVAPAVLLAVLGWTHRWTADDAFIDFRVVDQLLHGHGPVYNIGERVEAYTSPLWVGLLTVGSAVTGVGNVEWLAVGLGIALTVLGMVAASVAAILLNGRQDGLLLPLGALAFAVLPPAWEFVTSGLESGLAIGWVGTAFLACVLVRDETTWPFRRLSRRRGADLAAVLAGIGTFVRPDFAIFTVAFLVLIVLLAGPLRFWSAVRLVAFALALPVLYELFRMAYFAALVPNTALAKEASQTDWTRGVAYVWNTLSPYALLVPLIGFSGWSIALGSRDRAPGALALRLVPVVAAVVFGLYLAAIGGDFMHARLLLPAIFLVLAPAAVVPVRVRPVEVALAGGLAVWAAVCGFALGVPDHQTKYRVHDERRIYMMLAGKPHPVTLADYSGRLPWALAGHAARAWARKVPRVLTFYTPTPGIRVYPDSSLRLRAPGALVMAAGSIGTLGFAAGRDVFVADLFGLADPVASRQRLTKRGMAGHEKSLSKDWVVARFADPADLPIELRTAAAAAARRALACDGLARVLRDISRPMTIANALGNLRDSFSNTRLRFDPQPARAASELCRDRNR
jgi:arabinofuranosyltransferase